jgi:division protein CdvB (Snf7/Vps24/ESCRT-III family)
MNKEKMYLEKIEVLRKEIYFHIKIQERLIEENLRLDKQINQLKK